MAAPNAEKTEAAESSVTTYVVTVTRAAKPVTSVAIGHLRNTCTKRVPPPGADGHTCNNDDVWLGGKIPVDQLPEGLLDLPDADAGSITCVRVDSAVTLPKAAKEAAVEVDDSEVLAALGYSA